MKETCDKCRGVAENLVLAHRNGVNFLTATSLALNEFVELNGGLECQEQYSCMPIIRLKSMINRLKGYQNDRKS